MEIYFDRTPDTVTDKEKILAALRRAGLKPSASSEGQVWSVTFVGASAFVDFQDRDGALTFATLDQPTLGEHETSYAIFAVLEQLGWVADEESVG